MEKKDIVCRLLKEGIMVSAQELEKLDGSNIDQFITSKAKPSADASPISVSVDKFIQRKMDAKDFAKAYNDMFQRLRAMLVKKVDAVSVNKTKNVFSTVSIIAMVKSRTERGFVVEDETGEMEAMTDQALDEDDVVAITGAVREGKIFVSSVEYPEVPFNRPVGTMKAKALLGHLPKATADVVLDPMPPACLFTLSRGPEKVSILYYEPEHGTKLHQAGLWLKRRHLPSSWRSMALADPVLDPVPDIIWLKSEDAGSSVNKGVLIVSPGTGSALVDLETKDVQFL